MNGGQILSRRETRYVIIITEVVRNLKAEASCRRRPKYKKYKKCKPCQNEHLQQISFWKVSVKMDCTIEFNSFFYVS